MLAKGVPGRSQWSNRSLAPRLYVLRCLYMVTLCTCDNAIVPVEIWTYAFLGLILKVLLIKLFKCSLSDIEATNADNPCRGLNMTNVWPCGEHNYKQTIHRDQSRGQ